MVRRGREKADANAAAKKKARREREKKERAALKKKLNDFVNKHLALGTAAGHDYEEGVRKRQDAIDEHYAGTIAGKDAARKQRKKKDAAADSMELETQIKELRDTSGHLSRKKRKQIEDLEEKLAKKRKKARGVDKQIEAKAAKKRSEATKAVAELRRKLAKAQRDARAGRAKLVEELGKELATAERRLERLEANDRDAEALADLRSRIYALKESASGGTVRARNVGTVEQAFEQCTRLRRADKSAEIAALREAVVKLERARRGGGRGQKSAEEALEAVKFASPSGHVGLKRRRSQEVTQGVDDAESALVAAKRRRSDGKADDDDVKEAEKALDWAKWLQSRAEACGERAALRKACSERLDAIAKTKGGSPHLARALRDVTDALIVFVRQQRPVSEAETDALNKMMDVLANDKGAGVVKRRAEALAAFVEASTSSPKAQRREAAARVVADLKAQRDELPDTDDVDHDEEARARIEGELARAEEHVARLERTDELAKVAEELSRGLRELEASGTSDAAYQKSLVDAEAVVAKFRDLTRGICDYLSKAEPKLRDMVKVLRDSPGRSSTACTARDAAVTKAREALMTHDEIAKAAFEEGLAACTRLDTTSAVDAYNLAKRLSELPLDDVSRGLLCALSQTAIAKAREHVDALEPLLEDFGRLSRADRCALGGFIDEATEVLELLGGPQRRNFLCRVEVAEEALSNLDDERNALSAPRGKDAAFDRFCEAASTACTALGIATAFRGHEASASSLRYHRLEEEVARLRAELDGFMASERRGSAWDEELDERQAAWKAAFDKTNAGRRVAKWEAQVLAAAGTSQVLTRDIISDARVLTDKGHPVCAEMKEEKRVVYVGVTKEGNVDKEARSVIKRDDFPIKNDRGRPISFTQCRVVSLGVVDDRVTALLTEKSLQHEWANEEDNTPVDYAYQMCGTGSLTHTMGGSEVYIIGVTLAEGDQQSPSRYPRGRVLAFTPAFEAKIAAATAPPGSMPDERARGDLDTRMIKASPKRPVYHAYTRGPWSVHRWTKSRRAPFADEQRWLWPSAEAARKWTQDKIDQKTSERGGYAIEADDE